MEDCRWRIRTVQQPGYSYTPPIWYLVGSRKLYYLLLLLLVTHAMPWGDIALKAPDPLKANTDVLITSGCHRYDSDMLPCIVYGVVSITITNYLGRAWENCAVCW